jgi:hypothetical protein
LILAEEILINLYLELNLNAFFLWIYSDADAKIRFGTHEIIFTVITFLSLIFSILFLAASIMLLLGANQVRESGSSYLRNVFMCI